MRNKYLIYLIFINSFLYSQSDSIKYKNLIIKTDLIIPTISAFNGGYGGVISLEYCFLKRFGFQASYLYQHIPNPKNELINNQIISDVKIYLTNNKYKGLYSGLYFKNAQNYTKKTSENSGMEYSLIEYQKKSNGLGAIMGYQFFLKKRIAFDVLVGIGSRKTYNFKLINSINSSFNINNDYELDGRLQFLVGYKF